MGSFEKIVITPGNIGIAAQILDAAFCSVLFENITSAVGIIMGLRENKFDGMDAQLRLEHESSLGVVLYSDVYRNRLKGGYVIVPEETYRRRARSFDLRMRSRDTLVFLSIGSYLDVPEEEQFIGVFEDDIINHGFAFSKPAVVIRSTVKLPRRKQEVDFFDDFFWLRKKFSRNYRPLRSPLMVGPKSKGGGRLWREAVLRLAAEAGDVGKVRRMLIAGADVDAQDVTGETALMKAAGRRHFETSRFLVANGADVNLRQDRDGKTVLHILASMKKPEDLPGYISLVCSILEAGPDLEARDISGATALQRNIGDMLEGGPDEFLSLLIGAGASIETKMRRGSTPMDDAVHMGHTRKAKLLIAAGAEVNRPAGVSTALHQAVLRFAQDENVGWAFRFREFTQMLIEAGASLNSRDESGNSPLMALIDAYGEFKQNPHMEGFVAMLLEAGTDLSIRNDEGETAFDLAEKAKRQEFVRLLRAAEGMGANRRGLARALEERGASNGGVHPAAFLPRWKYTPLMEAMMNGDAATAARLIAEGADTRIRDADGRTALHLAARAGFFTGVRLLVEAGTDLNIRDFDGNTALSVMTYRTCGVDAARRKELQAVARLLIEGKMNLELKNCDGNTAVMEAARFAFPELVRLLVEAGSDLKATNRQKENVLDVAAVAVATALSPDELRDAVIIVTMLRGAGAEFGQCVEGGEVSCVRVPAIYKAHEDIAQSQNPTALKEALELVRLVGETGLEISPILIAPANTGKIKIHTVRYTCRSA